ncbi:MAG TPA: glycosyltransferase [Caldisericia bacterium]|nr:glycosyltransferase [Caldisericia bacterium]
MQKRKIVFVKPIMSQPRYHFDRTMELSKYFNIEWIIGWKLKENDIYPESQINHKIMFVGRGKPRKKFKGLFDQFLFTFKAANIIRKMNADLIIIHSNRINLLYPILCHKERDKFVMMTFTPAVNPSKLRRLFWDCYERIGFSVYKLFLIATEPMVEAFGLQKKKTYIVRWGMNPISIIPKIFDRMRLLYIGTLIGRDIHKTIYGLKEYLDTNPEIEVERYDIIGMGLKEYIDLIEKAIKETELSNIVYLHGYLNDQEIIPCFDKANVGIAYLPNTPYYSNVICTKVSEYLLSGIPTIAVATNENKKIINDINGVLIEDNEHSFAQGLHLMAKRFSSYSSEEIMKNVEKESLSYKVKNELVPTFNRIIKEIENISN